MGIESLSLMVFRFKSRISVLLEKDTWQPGANDTKGVKAGTAEGKFCIFSHQNLGAVGSSIKRESTCFF